MHVVYIGAKPYSKYGANQVKGLLARRYRMDRPTDCPVELYVSLSYYLLTILLSTLQLYNNPTH